MKQSIVLLLLSIAGLSACDQSVTGPVFSEDGFSVSVGSGNILLRNDSSAPIHYVALGEEESALVDLDPDCTTWQSVASGGEERIAYAEVGYDRGERQARIYWCTDGRYGPHIVVDLE